jgi:E3 ubiquitin-protein ligase BRE1
VCYADFQRAEKERDALMKTNLGLLQQSSEKDDMNAKSLSTILHLKTLTEKLAQEKDLLEMQLKSSEQVQFAIRLATNARERVTEESSKEKAALQETIDALHDECDKLKQAKEMANGDLSRKKAEMFTWEETAAKAKERTDELVSESTKQEEDKRALLEKLAIAQREALEASRTCATLRSRQQDGGGGDGGGSSVFTTDQLTTQISVLKSRLACPVCNHRDKKCILLRCRHMFCKQCVDETVRNRSRKCPACGQRFDTKDIGDVWL